jgi:rubrerythrin
MAGQQQVRPAEDPPIAGDTMIVERPEQLWKPQSRRNFLRLMGIGGAVVLLPSVFTGCIDEDDPTVTGPGTDGQPVTLDLRTDTGILNYAYALEQLEAGFYVTAVSNSAGFNAMTADQKEVFVDLRNHEVIHREFLRRVLGTAAIGSLALNSTNATTAVSSVANLLATAETLEDTGVAAYNGAGKYLTSDANLTVAGKIVSVEARHAAAVRDMRDMLGVRNAGAAAGTRFADAEVVVGSGTYAGLDVKLEPARILQRVAASGLVSTSISIGNAPAAKSGTPDHPAA